MADLDTVHGKYRHYKGTEYEVLSVGVHTETEEKMVVYRAIHNPEKIWIRPYEMFLETVVIDGKAMPRFEHISQ